MKLGSPSEGAYFTAADAYEELGWYDKALELRTKLLECDLKDAYRWNARAKVYERLGRHGLALSDRRKVNELASPSDRLHMHGCVPLIDFNKLYQFEERPQERINNQLKGVAVVLPFDYDDGGHFSVPAQVNGHSLRLMLDTGCGHSDLWKQAMSGVAEVDKTQLLGTYANGSEYKFSSFRARDLKLGDLTLSNVAMAVDDGLVGHKTIGGFLGGNILENFVVTVDYKKKQVILASSFSQRTSKSAIVAPMWIRSHRPRCRVRLDGKLEIVAMLDTGCPSSMSADSLLKPILSKKLDYKEHISGPWLGELSSESVRFKSVSIGAADFESPVFDAYPAAEAPQAADEVILGNDFLSGFKTVTFDYPARRIIFEPNEIASKSAATLYREGRFYLAHHEEKRAIDSFTKAVNVDREFAPLCYFYRGLAFECLKQYQQALADCNAVIKLDAKAYWAYHLRALVYNGLGRQQLAESDLRMEKKLKGH
jgi:tetratricopeptide (TPR) repeat protein